jgi:hypothetical protein
MTCAQYFVVERDGKWNFKFKEKIFGPFKGRNEALQRAIEAADAASRRGDEALVFLEDIDDVFKTWKFGTSHHGGGDYMP